MVGGSVSYRIGFLGHEGAWQGDEYDVQLVSKKYDMTLGFKGAVPPRAFMASVNVSLCCTCGWEVVNMRARGAPSSRDFESVMRHLSAMHIRGGFYSGPEDVYLMSVKLERPTSGAAGSAHTRRSREPKQVAKRWQITHETGSIFGLNDTHLFYADAKAKKIPLAVPFGDIASVDVDEHGAVTVMRKPP
jgi:hypothetical protein